MKTKNIFKTLALAMLMPAMMLTTACSNDDDLVNNTANTETVANKGYALPVTVNVTRGDGATRASFDGSKLNFSAGDKLFVEGINSSVGGPGQFAGELTWQSGGTFSGTIYTQNEWTGTADALFTDASASGIVKATLLPKGYESYNFLSIYNNSSDDLYDDVVAYSMSKAFVASETAKKTGVEQLSWEKASTYSSGFALTPMNAIANFTISGLTANKEVAVSFDTNGMGVISENVTTSAEGVATFAVGVYSSRHLEDCTLTVGGNNIAMPTKEVEPGHIYNISRSVPPADGHALSASAVGEIVGTDGKAYAASGKNNLPTGVKAEAVVTYKSGSNGFALAIVDYPNKGDYDAVSGTYLTQWRSAHPVSGCTWVLPTRGQWENTYNGCAGTAPAAIYPVAGYEGNMGNLNTYLTGADGTAMNDNHWTSTAYDSKEWVCTNSNSAANTCNFNRNDYDRNLLSRYGIAF